MDEEIKSYRFEAYFEFNYWGCIVSAHSKQEAVDFVFKELNLPFGIAYSIKELSE